MDMAARNRQVIESFRAGGEIEGMHREGLLLLTTTGRVSGVERTTPMMFHRDGDRLYVIASNAGAVDDPQWYRNLLADPAVTVEVGEQRYAATAVPLVGDDYARTWAEIQARYPFFTEHQQGVSRAIPVVSLERD